MISGVDPSGYAVWQSINTRAAYHVRLAERPPAQYNSGNFSFVLERRQDDDLPVVATLMQGTHTDSHYHDTYPRVHRHGVAAEMYPFCHQVGESVNQRAVSVHLPQRWSGRLTTDGMSQAGAGTGTSSGEMEQTADGRFRRVILEESQLVTGHAPQHGAIAAQGARGAQFLQTRAGQGGAAAETGRGVVYKGTLDG
ncbi:hypothetical protein K458DRAFT_383969 [Lentithecium fluviatile CBS 122367]|uniref:Uncharacterized protein n=1 Tax=Lentithecium fluviatile CBS 122367 TaxID=1168545 RepID=A0A6G1JGP4_9PLEO|nr:hypothetical protein K458DRAFT_383969 [Lentithecium fluviatile CBS 122367]